MNTNEIKEGVKDKHWYYYYNFDGIEVNKKKKKDKALGVHNWNRIKPVMDNLFSLVVNPYVLDIGCNMGFYDHEMTKMGAKVTAIDFNTKNIEFYKKYLVENKKEKWDVEIINMDVTKESFVSESINIVTMFCVLYHLGDYKDFVFDNFRKYLTKHKYIVIQGNIPRIKKYNQVEAGVEGMKDMLERNGYSIYKVFEWDRDIKNQLLLGK